MARDRICLNCSRKRYQEYYHKNRPKILLRKRQYRKQNREHINSLEQSPKRIEKKQQYRKKNREILYRKDRLRYQLNKIALLNLLTNGDVKCAYCGFSNINALQFDHIHNDGTNDRKRFNKLNSTMYNYYVKHPKEAKRKLQVLCANCNWIKWSEAD